MGEAWRELGHRHRAPRTVCRRGPHLRGRRPGVPPSLGSRELLGLTFCGDADRDETVLNLREMVAKLRSAGNPAKLTEYRSVGHNSWDRAYNGPGLIDWMLAQARP